jgi:putative membrane protein
MYLFFKWLHLVAVISWMAGILYLFRLYVNHAEFGKTSQDVHRLLTRMEQRLYKIITVPAMITAFVGGLSMVAINPGIAQGGWFHVKFTAVIALAGLTGYAGKLRRKFAAQDPGVPSVKALRIANEVPAVLMMIIVGMAVFRPF